MNLQNLNLDIRTAVVTATILAYLFAALVLWSGFRTIQTARRLNFYRLRQEGMVRGWRMLLGAFVLFVLGLLIRSYAEPVAYSYFPPSPTPTLTPSLTLTPTITLTPSITLTPTVSNTPSVTDTPTPTPTPFIPLHIELQFESTLEPNPNAVFSELIFTQGIDENYIPLNASDVFTNPVGHLYAVFSYDQMVDGVQWTALWYREGEIVHYETAPWNGGTGGFGYTDWNPSPEAWLPGFYSVHMFLGLQLYQSGSFTVLGDPITPTGTLLTATPTGQLTPTITPRPTYPPTITPTPTITRWPTATAITPSPTLTRLPTLTNTPLPGQ